VTLHLQASSEHEGGVGQQATSSCAVVAHWAQLDHQTALGSLQTAVLQHTLVNLCYT
jgi:hypothetical protein